MSAALFRRRLALLRSFGANVLALPEAVRRVQQHSLPKRSVVITFDDGFYDFLRHAVPALQEFGYPATLYLTTHYCRYPFPVFNLAAEYVLWKSGRPSVDLRTVGIDREMPIATYPQRQAVKNALLQYSGENQLDTVAKNELIHRMAESLGVDYPRIVAGRLLQLLRPDEVAEVARMGIDIQLHTHRHRTPRNRDLFLREIYDNAQSIEQYTGRRPTHFCYPSGDYDFCFLPWLKECNVESATTCLPGLSGPNSEPLLLPRFLDDSFVSDLDFESYLCGMRG